MRRISTFLIYALCTTEDIHLTKFSLLYLNTAVGKTECRTQQGSSRQHVIGLYPVLSSDEQHLNTGVGKIECRTQQGSSRQYVIGLYPVLSSDEQHLNTAVGRTECRTQQGSSCQYVIGLYPVLSSDEQHGSTADEGGLAVCGHGEYIHRNYCDLRCS
jgi:hypothetical protein